MTEPLLSATAPSIAAMAASLTSENVTASGSKWPCHRLPPSEAKLTISLYVALLTLITASATKEAQYVADLPVGDLPCYMDYLKHLKMAVENLDSDLPCVLQQQRIEDISEISPNHEEEAKEKVIGLAQEFFQTLRPQFYAQEVLSSAYGDFLNQKCYQSCSEILVKHCGYTQVQSSLTLSSDDLSFLGLPRDGNTPSTKEMDSAAYVFLTLREQRACELIVSGLDANQPNDMNNAFYGKGGLTLLRIWGYQPVESPASQDIAIYLRRNNITHVGIVQDNGLIQSKIGKDPGIYLHRIEDVLGHIGNRVIFFRKSRHPLHRTPL